MELFKGPNGLWRVIDDLVPGHYRVINRSGISPGSERVCYVRDADGREYKGVHKSLDSAVALAAELDGNPDHPIRRALEESAQVDSMFPC